MKVMKIVCVTGYRNFKDEKFVHDKLTELFRKEEYQFLQIITGGCNCKEYDPPIGVDYFAKKWALKNGCNYKEFEADWNMYGKRAGPIRNTEMTDYLEECRVIKCEIEVLGFVHPESKGTKDMLKKAKGARIKVTEFEIE